MFILGLTGSIGMGKTTAAEDFRSEGVPVHDADATVHTLLDVGGKAVDAISRVFPDCVSGGVIDRQALGERVFGDEAALKTLEGILHPLVRVEANSFLAENAEQNAPLVVLDIPLLFETGAEERCDAVCVVSAPGSVQRERVLSRPGMTEEKLASILSHQMPDAEKRQRADFVIETGDGRADSLRTIRELVTLLSEKPGTKWNTDD